MSGQARQGRGDHGGEGHEHAHRIARQGDDGHLPGRSAVLDAHRAVALRPARLHGDLGEAQSYRSARGAVVLRQHDQGVESACRHPAGGDDEVGPASRLGERHHQRLGGVTAARHRGESGAVLGDQPRQQQGVGVGDGAGGQYPAGVDELGAGGHDGDPRSGDGAHRGQADRGERGDGRRRHERARRQDGGADADVLARPAHVETRSGGSPDSDLGGRRVRAGHLVGVLDPDDGVGVLGQHRTGHDPLGRAGGQGRRGGSGRHVPAHRQDDGGLRRGRLRVPGAHRVAVHGRVRPRGHRQGGGDVLREHQAVRLGQGSIDGGQGGERGEDLGDIGLDTEHVGHLGRLGRLGHGSPFRCRSVGGDARGCGPRRCLYGAHHARPDVLM